jgi:hypothetical protein
MPGRRRFLADSGENQQCRGVRRAVWVQSGRKIGAEVEEDRRQNPGAGSEIRAPPSGFPDGLLAGFVKFTVFEHAAEDEPCADAETED